MRKYFIDNLRCGIVLSVIFYHVFYMFNSVGVIGNVDIKGIPQLDLVLYILYPWFMAALFLLAGISARYALQKRTDKEFLKERVRKLLVPSICGIFILGWIGGFITNQYVDMFAGNGAMIPGVFKYLIYCMAGIGPLWFAQELFLASLVLLILRKIDRKDRIWTFCGKTNVLVLILLFFAVWGSSHILNTPMIEIYRNGIYIFMFLLGYYVFSHEEIQRTTAKYRVLFLAVAVLSGIYYVITFWGKNYTEMGNLQAFQTNLYAWFMILALLGCGFTWWNKETAFTRYLRPRSFGFYVLHYPLLVLMAFLIDRYINPPVGVFYIILLVLEAVLLPLFYEVVKRIPVLKRLLLGI